ncbi:fructosamine kinase family protein [Cyanobacterium sp. uoEpiScrs1]|uniref:fructosamine kinase family protein n=1 Tax=Cyanobacterium sp. uoEpiScrs1 TaxID=2976343 RepID=UPI00226A3E94|nr:fructosamine kinase family protein [Cyanobacterium sp. uoEpiScrs1]
MWTQIAQHISQVTQQEFRIKNRRSINGGCTSQCYSLIGDNITYFVKINRAAKAKMFVAEVLNLKHILDTKSIRVPKAICWGIAENISYIVLEWIEFSRVTNQSWKEMGRKLGLMHYHQGADQFGWKHNNMIGSIPQINIWTDNWANFFAEHRIGYQLKLTKRCEIDFPERTQVVEMVRKLLSDRKPKPSLVHGDLWSGNTAATTEKEPVILDPATYYGDHEVDLAMTELFGGFPHEFYRGYNEIFSLDKGYQKRKIIYNLYHILNHFNLFGNGYGYQAKQIIKMILAGTLQ